MNATNYLSAAAGPVLELIRVGRGHVCSCLLARAAGRRGLIGGGTENSCSLLEAFERAGSITGKPMNHYLDQPRVGDHVC
jgi:hypothetical protein